MMTALALLAPVLAFAALAGCGQSMSDQPRYDTYSNAPSFEDGTSARGRRRAPSPQSATAYAEAEKVAARRRASTR